MGTIRGLNLCSIRILIEAVRENKKEETIEKNNNQRESIRVYVRLIHYKRYSCTEEVNEEVKGKKGGFAYCVHWYEEGLW